MSIKHWLTSQRTQYCPLAHKGADGFLTGSTRLAMIVRFSSVVAIEKKSMRVCKAKIKMIIIAIMTKHDKMGHGWPGVHEVK